MSLIPTKPYYQAHRMLYEPDAKDIAKRWGIPERLFLNLITAESSWNPDARSSAGAIGLTQLMPGTISGMGATVSRVQNSPTLQMSLGARYLKQQYDTFGDWRLAVAAYNAGAGAVKKYGGVPPYTETRNYVDKVMSGTDLQVTEQPKSLEGQSNNLLGGLSFDAITKPIGTYLTMAVFYILVAVMIIIALYFVFRKDVNAVEDFGRVAKSRGKEVAKGIKAVAKKIEKK